MYFNNLIISATHNPEQQVMFNVENLTNKMNNYLYISLIVLLFVYVYASMNFGKQRKL